MKINHQSLNRFFALFLFVHLIGCSDSRYDQLQPVDGDTVVEPESTEENEVNGKADPMECVPELIGNWKTIVVDPKAIVIHTGNEPSSTDIEEFATLLKKSIEKQGLTAREKHENDKRWITLSFHAVNRGRDGPFIVTLSQTEFVQIERNGKSITAPAVTWEIQDTFFMQFGRSSQWPIIEKAIGIMAKRFADSINEGKANIGK